VQHWLTVSILPLYDSSDLYIEIEYETEQPVAFDRYVNRTSNESLIADLIHSLSGQLASTSVTSTFVSSNAENLLPQTVIKLPMEFFKADAIGAPVHEIRGIRGVKYRPDPESKDDVEYSFIMDRPSNEEISLHITRFLEVRDFYVQYLSDFLHAAEEIATSLGFYRIPRQSTPPKGVKG
jgi:hypothetical protein